MDFEVYHKYPPGDPTLVEKIVCHLKAQGIFDNFRKECLSDVDTKPAYQNLRQRVDGSVAGYLSGHKWKPDLNKNQLRESLRKYIQNGGFLEVGVERIVDQVVNPKIGQVFLPRVRDVVFEGLGLKEESDNNATASDRPASTSYMPSSSATSSTYTSASICNQIDDSKEKADLEKEVVPFIESEVKKEDNETANVEHSDEIVASNVELDPVIETEKTVIKLETQNETRSNDSCDSRISGISDLTSVKSNASDEDNNLDKSPNTDEEREDQEDADNIDKSMTSVNEDDENSQDKIEMPSNVIHESTFSNLSFSSEFTTQIENVEIETDQIGTSVVECVTTENNEEDTDGRDSPNLMAKSVEPNVDSDSNAEIEVHESTEVEYDYTHDKKYYKDGDENVYEESSRGLHSDHKEESQFEESQSETDVERFDSTSNEMRFSENVNCFDDGKLEQSSEDERFKSHSSKEQEEAEKERKYRKDQERKHHSKHKDHHSNSSSGESREDRKHRRSKDKHRHKRDDDDAEGKSRKTHDHSDSKHRRSRRGAEEAAASIYQEETSRSETDTKNKYEEKVKKSHKERSRRSRDYENVYEENTYNEDEESKSECDEKNRYKNSQDEKYSSSRDRKMAKKHETRDYEYGNTTSDHEEASRSESDEINKYRENPEYSHEESPTKKRKKITDEDHEHEERTSDYELANKSKSKEKNRFQEQVKFPYEEKHTHSRDRKKASKTETHEYEEETTFDNEEPIKSESDEKNRYKDKAEFSSEETPARRRVRKKAFKEDYEYGEITSDYEEECKSESEEKNKYKEKVKYSHEKSNSRSRDRKKASKVETHDDEYEETTLDHEESSKSESDEKNTYIEKTKFSHEKKDSRSKDRKKATKEESNKFEDKESAFDLKKQSKNEFDEENEYQEEKKSQKERPSRSKRHKNATIEKENEEKVRSDGEETGKSESEEKNRNQEKLKKEKHSRSREYEMSHDDEQEEAIFYGEGTSKGKSGEKKKSKHSRKERHSRSQDKKHESNVRTHEDEYEETILGQQEANESEIDIENQNQKVEKSREESHSRSRDHKHVSKESAHDGDHKRKKEEQSHHRGDSSSKNEHSTTQDEVKKDRSHKTSSREHKSSHRSSRDKHAEKESENYDQEKHKHGEDNDERKKDKSKSRKSRDSCKPADESGQQRRSADGDSSGTGDGRGLGGASAASSRHTRSQRTKTKESRSGGKGSHSSTSDSAVLEDSQDYFGHNYEEECVETVVQSSLPTNYNGVHFAVSAAGEDNSNSSVRIISEENEDTQIFQETTENNDGERADDVATKEQETPKRELDQLSTEYIENRITTEFEGPKFSNNELEQQKELELSTINSPINSQENGENKENHEENSKSNYQVSETDVLDNTVVQQEGETKRGNEETNNDQPNPDIFFTSQNIETQLPEGEGVIFRKKKTAENMAELRKIMRERRRNQRIQKKRLSMGDSAAKYDHSPMTNQSIDNSALEENGQVESLTSVEGNKEIVLDKVPEPNESNFEIRVESSGETVQNTDSHSLPKVEVKSCNYKRPKVAANIFEVRKIIKARKRLRRIEEKKRINLPHLYSNKQSLEGKSKIRIEDSKENNDEIHENSPTNKSRSCKNKRNNERPVFGKKLKRDSKGRFAKKVSNKPESDSTHERTDNKTENLITLKIKSQECVGNETKNFECKSSLSYQDINQLASKCLVVKLKKLDVTNLKNNSDEVTDSVESLSADKTDDLPESELSVQNNENENKFLDNTDTITSRSEVIEQKLHSVDARQVEEADLSIRESEIADNNCGPSKTFTGESEKNRPRRQLESTSEVPDSDEVDEQFTHEKSKSIFNTTEVKNSCESGPIVLQDNVIGSRSCEITKFVDNVPEIENTTESTATLNDSTKSDSDDIMQSIEEVQSSNSSETLEEKIQSNSNGKLQSIEEIQILNSSENLEERIQTNSSGKLQSIEEVQSLNSSENLEERIQTNSRGELQSIEEVHSLNSSENLEERMQTNSSGKLQSIEEVQSFNSSENLEERIQTNSSGQLQSIEEVQCLNASETLKEGIECSPSGKLQSVEEVPKVQNLKPLKQTDSDDFEPLTSVGKDVVSSPMRGFDIDPDEIIAYVRKDQLVTRPRARSKSPYEPNNKYIENENGDILGFLDEENPRHRESRYFNKSEIQNAREKLEKFKTILNTFEKEYKDLKDLQKTEFVTSDFALDKKFDSYLEKECGIQVLRKDCVILPSLNDENYFFDKESGCYYLKNRLVDRSKICKKNKEVKETSVGKSKVVLSGESSGCFTEKRSVRGKFVSKEQRKSPVKLRISIRNPNSSAIETEEINVPYTSDVESSTDGSAGRISIDSRKSIEDAASESELNKCNDQVRASTPLQDDDSVENERVQPSTDQVSVLKNSSKTTKKKRSHSRRKRSSNSSTIVTSQEFRIKTCPEAENNNLPSAAHSNPFKITLSRNISRIIAPQSPSSQSNNVSMEAAIPSESESRFVVGKRHSSKTDSVDDGSCSPKKKFHSSVSDTDLINVDQAIETVTDSLDNSFEEEADFSLDEGMASNMIGEALKNLIAESGLATTTQSPPSYQETKEPARITKHQRNQKLSVEHENTVSPPKKIRNSVRLSAGVRLPKRYEDADLYKPRLDCGQGNRRKRKPGEPVIDSLVDNEPPIKRRLSNVIGTARRSSR